MDIQAIYERGGKTINAIYSPALLPQIFGTWDNHEHDVRFNEASAIYGLYLSDFKVLTPLEAEAVVYATISYLGLGGPGNWHLRGISRMLGAREKTDNGTNAEMKVNSRAFGRQLLQWWSLLVRISWFEQSWRSGQMLRRCWSTSRDGGMVRWKRPRTVDFVKIDYVQYCSPVGFRVNSN